MSTTYEEARTPEQVALDREVLNRVLKGIEILKEEYGDDWVDKINLDTLRLSSGISCVLGQLNGGDFCKGISKFQIQGFDMGRGGEQFGFTAFRFSSEYDILDRVWKREIEHLRAERSTAS